MSGIQKLINGYRQFHNKYFNSSNSLFSSLRGGQSPRAMVISCCDSRVSPVMLTDCAPGDLFVVRNIANLVPGTDAADHQFSVVAAVEFAAITLRVEHIIVLGHSQCGGIDALLKKARGEEILDSLDKWISCAESVATTILAEHPDENPERQAELCEQASVVSSLNHLRVLPFLDRALSSGALRLHGWYFDIQTGQLSSYDEKKKSFSPLT